VFAGDAQVVLPRGDLHAEGIADHAQVFVRRSVKGQLLVGLFQGDIELHVLAGLYAKTIPLRMANKSYLKRLFHKVLRVIFAATSASF
jgi:hypothetical protein